MVMLVQSRFEWLRGLRKPSNLMSPRISRAEDFQLPKASIVHFVGEGVDGPDPTDTMYGDNKRILPLMQVTELSSLEGGPRLMPGQPATLIRTFHMKNRKFRKALDISSATRDLMAPLTINYSLIDRRYKYIKNMYQLVNRWSNLTKTIIENVEKVANESDWNQYVIFDLPEKLPSLSILRQASKQMSTTLLKQFNTGEALLVFEFWKWLSAENRDKSIFGVISPKNYRKVNIVLRDGGFWTMFNMATLNSWRIGTPAEKAVDENAPTKGWPAVKIQMLFIKYLMQIQLARSGDIEILDKLDEVIEDIEISKEVLVKDDEVVVDTKETTNDAQIEYVEGEIPVVADDVHKEMSAALARQETQLNSVAKARDKEETIAVTNVDNRMPENKGNVTTKPTGKDIVKVVNDVTNDEEVRIDNRTGEFIIDSKAQAELEKDLEALEVLQEKFDKKAAQEESLMMLKADDIKTYDEKLMEHAVKKADEGAMTAAEYRRFEKLANTYKDIKFPGTDKTVATVMEVKPEQIQLEDPPKYKDNPTVFDKSMLQSTLDKFDSQYLKEVMDADTASCIMSIQNAGVCVTDIEKEVLEDATGKYNNWKIKLQPVEGKASTVWMKTPYINEDGVFTANGVDYRLRKKRRDRKNFIL